MQISNYSNSSIHCQNCLIKDVCIAASLSVKDLGRFDKIVQHPKPLQKSETLFYAGEKLQYIYAIRKGSLKALISRIMAKSKLQVFIKLGELLGMDALARKKHHSFAKALEPTEVCAIPYEKLDQLASLVPELHSKLMNVMSSEISKQYDVMMNLNQRAADQKVANFILNLYLSSHRQSDEEIQLHMTRSEIGNYLGLALETVSRIFSKFKQQEIIELNCKKVKVLDVAKLNQISGLEVEERLVA